MKNFKVLLLLIITSLIFISTHISLAEAEKVQVQPEQVRSIRAKSLDPRAYILKKYLAQFNSPLEDHAQDFIDAADLYSVDWKLVPAIAGVESTFGKHTPGGTEPTFTSYNCWGWGVYGTQALYFKSYNDGIHTVTKGLKENYIDKGYTEPYAMNRIYAASPHWGGKVTYFITDIEKFSKENFPLTQSFLGSDLTKITTAGPSANLIAEKNNFDLLKN